MSYPLDVVTRQVVVPGARSIEAGAPVTRTVTVKSTRGLIRVGGGQFPSVARSQTVTDGSDVTWDLPVTDQSNWKTEGSQPEIIDVSEPGSYTHRYIITVTENGVTKRTYGPFALPTEDLTPVDADALVEVPTVAGTVVSVPDSWSAQVAQAVAAAATINDGLAAELAAFNAEMGA